MQALVFVAGAVASLPLFGQEPAKPTPAPPQALAAARMARPARPAPQSGPYSWTTGNYDYDGAGNIISIGTQAFGYDQRSRLTYGKVTTPTTWSEQSFTYDVYGNMSVRSTGGMATTIGVDAGTNRLTDWDAAYDAAGNLTQWQPQGASHKHRFTYDGLNMVTEELIDNAALPRMTYVYTADDERIAVEDQSTNVSHWKIRGLDQKVLRDYQLSGTTWSVYRDYVYRGSQMLAAITPTTVEHFSLDHLGTPRLITDQSAQKIGFHTYLPFGDEIGAAAQEGEPKKFTGHERDPDPMGETGGLDYMHARYYASMPGRFLSVDPVLNVDRSVANPQRWNRYGYVVNNPVSLVDPDGRADFNPFSIFKKFLEIHFDPHHGAPSLDVTNARSGIVKRASIDGPENFLKPIVHEGAEEALSNAERKLVIEAMKESPKALRLLARLGIKLTGVLVVVAELAHADDANAQEGPIDVAHRLFPQTKAQGLSASQRKIVDEVLTGARDANGHPKAKPAETEQCQNGKASAGC